MFLDFMHDEQLQQHTARQIISHVKGPFRQFELDDLQCATDDGYPLPGHNLYTDGSVNPACCDFSLASFALFYPHRNLDIHPATAN